MYIILNITVYTQYGKEFILYYYISQLYIYFCSLNIMKNSLQIPYELKHIVILYK